jgi:tetratricopeptide (TPR) repeat protein
MGPHRVVLTLSLLVRRFAARPAPTIARVVFAVGLLAIAGRVAVASSAHAVASGPFPLATAARSSLIATPEELADVDAILAAPPLEVVPPTAVDLPAIPTLEGPAPETALRVPERTAVLGAPAALATRSRSIEQLATCHAALARRHYESASRACRAAAAIWDGNHLAWYSLANALAALERWPEARDAARHAVDQRPERAMYQLRFALALYHTRAADRLAGARTAVERALALEPRLWRARYLLGVVATDQGDARAAALALDAAVRANPAYAPSYLALAQLYRTTHHLDEALAVAKVGTQRASTSPDLWYERALVHDTRVEYLDAIDAIDHALDRRPDDALLTLERGRLFFQLDDFPAAHRDLLTATRATDPRIRLRASQLLTDLARLRPRRCTGPKAACASSVPANETWQNSAMVAP